MYIKHIPVAAVRAAATHAAALWRQVDEKVNEQDWVGAVRAAAVVRDHLVGAEIVALSSLIEDWTRALVSESGRVAATANRSVIEYELNLLAKAKVEPSVWLKATADELLSAAGRGEAKQENFFLPVVPTPSGGRMGSPIAAQADFGLLLADQLSVYGHPEFSLASLRNTLHAIENRGLPGALGGAFTLVMGAMERTWVEDVGHVWGEDGEVEDLRLLSQWLAAAADNADYKPTLKNLQLLSKFALKVAHSVGPRGQALSRHLGLHDLLDGRSDSTDKLPPAAVFGARYHQLVTTWEAVAYDPAKGKEFIEAFRAMLDITRDSPNLTRIVRAAGTLFNSFRAVNYSDRAKAYATMAEIIAAIQDAYSSFDQSTIEATSRHCQETVDQMIASGVPQGLSLAPVLPVADLYSEVAKEVSRVEASLAKGDVSAAISGLDNVGLSLSLVAGTEVGKAVASAVAAISEFLRQHPDVEIAKAVAQLSQAFGMAATSPSAVLELVSDIKHQLQKALNTAAAPLPVDEPEDPEIFEIFNAEATEVCQQIVDLCNAAQSEGSVDAERGNEIRRHWHTIKGSARMAALTNLGEGAWEFERRLNDSLSGGNVPIAWAQASLDGVALVRRICDEIASNGRSEVDLNKFMTALEPVGGAPKAVEQAPVQVLPHEPAADPWVVEAVEAAPELAPTAAFDASVETAATAMSIDPDIMRAFQSDGMSMIKIIQAAAPDVVGVGVSYDLVRAAHSLVGIAGIVGLKPMEALAESLESWAAFHYSRSIVPDEESAKLVGEIGLEMGRIVENFSNGQVREVRLDLAGALTHFGSDADGAESIAIAEHEAQKSAAAQPAAERSEHDPVVSTAAVMWDKHPPVWVTSRSAEHPAQTQDLDRMTEAAPPVLTAQEPEPSAGAERPVDDGVVAFAVDEAAVDDIDRDVLQAYVDEAEESLAAIDEMIASFVPGVTSFVEMNRLIHTIKGGARLCGMLRLGSMLHSMEDATMASDTLSERDSRGLVERVQRSLDRMRVMLRQAVAGNQAATLAAEPDNDGLRGAGAAQKAPVAEAAALRVSQHRLEMISDDLGQLRVTQDRVKRRTSAGFETIDQLKDPISRVQALAQRISDDAESSMDAGVRRSSSAQGFDALEMDQFTVMHENTRRLVEAVNDIANIVQNTDESLRDIDAAMRQQGELSDRIHQGINAIGLSGLFSVEARLRATVRQAADETGKQCQLQIEGDAKIERSVMDRVVPALEHLIRNSVAHGIESRDVRSSRGKPAQGLITLNARSERSYAIITLRDDGNGIDVDRVRAQAIKRGLLSADQVVGEKEIVDLIFAPGFSTAETITTLAGRGVGMDAVRDAIQRIGGRIETKTVAGKGLEFTLRVPTSINYISGLLMYYKNAPYIVPSALVDSVQLVDGKEIERAIADPGSVVSLTNGGEKAVYSVGFLCGVPASLGKPRVRAHHNVLVPRGGHDYVLFAEQSEHVNNLPLRHFPDDVPMEAGILGYSTLSDGRVAVVINPELIVSKIRRLDSAAGAANDMGGEHEEDVSPLILVVDDSITVRSVTSRMLVKNGLRVATAENGAIALERAMDERPAAILMDIEMPVMDGFEALRALKASAELQDIPVAIISSRNADKHRGVAMDIGADAFFGKPYQEAELLAWIGESGKKKKALPIAA